MSIRFNIYNLMDMKSFGKNNRFIWITLFVIVLAYIIFAGIDSFILGFTIAFVAASYNFDSNSLDSKEKFINKYGVYIFIFVLVVVCSFCIEHFISFDIKISSVMLLSNNKDKLNLSISDIMNRFGSYDNYLKSIATSIDDDFMVRYY
jgi:hypothetical protein